MAEENQEPTKIQDIWIRMHGPVMMKGTGEYAGIDTAIGVGPVKGKTIRQCVDRAKSQLGKLATPMDLPGGMEVTHWTQFVVHVDGDPFPIAWGVLSPDAGGNLEFDVERQPDMAVCLDTRCEGFLTDGADPGAKLSFEHVGSTRDPDEDDDCDNPDDD